jgi:hypothetical protein
MMPKMSEIAPLTTQPLPYRRQTRFTPTNIRQVSNRIERGKSKKEMAQIIGVAPAPLYVL